MYFQDKLDQFFDLLFPELSSVGSGTEQECKVMISNFILAYLALYDSKFIPTTYTCEIGEMSLLACDIKEIRETLKMVNELSDILSLSNGDKYDNIIVKFVIDKLYKGEYYKEKQFIACFTNAYLYKIHYLSRQQLIEASGVDIEMVKTIILILSSLDSILNIESQEDINNLLREEVLI